MCPVDETEGDDVQTGRADRVRQAAQSSARPAAGNELQHVDPCRAAMQWAVSTSPTIHQLTR
ncbi:hypothetical protein Kfla_4326 [Kribbella flavida DSM 17836]|uniref:Uncharacterized protein n=1 Tax=Kribbella flavida (strain DSM 17836 / JCM 10339 / NBRC 14399) TaxID=479435 RepID=D2PV79_KRIFD|nr:hypothetical protein [Kribbella flavida]ADB33360.1 hypothetical protein Kfla_4326 [Kribbella flavida DSM 17836]